MLLRYVAARFPAPANGQVPLPHRLLLIQPDHLGDVLLRSPALAYFQEALPDTDLTCLVGPWSADVIRHGPLTPRTHVRELRFPGFTRTASLQPLAPYQLLLRSARELRAGRFDAAVVQRPDHWWGALLVAIAGIPVRIGTAVPDTHELLTHTVPAQAETAAGAHALRLAELAATILGDRALPTPVPAPIFRTTHPEQAEAADFLQAQGLGRAAPVLLHPSAGAPLKSWPEARWAHLAERIRAEVAPVVLLAGPGEGGLLQAIQERMAAPVAAIFAGRPLGSVAALLSRCALAVGPDNGILHVAAAVGTPTVRLYGPASRRAFGPWPPSSTQQALAFDELACVPCGALVKPPCGAVTNPPCMLALHPNHVLDAIWRALAQPMGA